jgi:hypothetical protein
MPTKKERPYSPSWVDRFTDWLNSLPVPVWLSIALIYLLAVSSFHLAYWLDGGVPFWTVDPFLLFNGVWSVIGLIFIMSLHRISNRAIDKFSTLVPRTRKELELLRYQMTTIPAGLAALLTLIVVVGISAGAYFDPSFLGVSQPIPVLIFIVGVIFSYSFAPIMLVHGFRQLTMVIKAYRMVDEVNLFHLQPLYAFSGLSMTSSMFWVVILNLNFISNSWSGVSSVSNTTLSIFLAVLYVLLAFASFIAPLWGIHVRIRQTKEEAIEENGLQIEKAHQSLYRLLNKADYKKTTDLEKTLASLYNMRAQIEKVPTWPWNAGTLRGFLSAVFLPLGIWFTQQILLRFL